MARPVIALLTDFGTSGHYVGVVKGVVLGICPDAALVDLTHDIPPQDVMAAAFELAAAYRYFPAGTIFLVVVDPGVGTRRRAIAAEAGAYRFVGPDNGVFGRVFSETVPARMVELTEARYLRPVISPTFEGRDRFGPAAAWLATGVPLTALGPAVDRYTPLAVALPVPRPGGVDGEVIWVDRFGNLVTNIDRATFDAAVGRGTAVHVEVSGTSIVDVVSTYADVAPATLCALFGSSDYLEIARTGGSAAVTLGVGVGTAVRVSGRA